MKTLAEIEQWRIGVAEQFGDPAAVTGQIFARFVRRIDRPHPDAIATWDKNMLMLSLEYGRLLPVPIDVDGPLGDDETGQLVAFGIEQVCPGVWTITPSLNMPGLIHAFVCIYDVPAVAPWENRIIVVSSMNAIAGRAG